jgi:FkbM family methyltransferase
MSQVIATSPDGTKFPFLLHDKQDQFISERIRQRGSWEPFETRVMLSLLNRGDVVVDIGANIGWYTIALALQIGESGRVFAFEPEPDNADLLEQSVALNRLSNVRLFRCALSESPGTLQLIKSVTNMGDHRVSTLPSGQLQGIDVPVDTLDRLVASGAVDLKRARIVKIDTQGAEVLVLRGARNAFANLTDTCAVFVEFSPNLLRQHGNDFPQHFLDVLHTLARDIYLINARYRTLHRVTQTELHGFAATCIGGSDDAGVDLILAPHNDKTLDRFCRFYAPLVKSKVLPSMGSSSSVSATAARTHAIGADRLQ